MSQFSLSAWKELIQQWFGRIAVTIIIVAVWDYYFNASKGKSKLAATTASATPSDESTTKAHSSVRVIEQSDRDAAVAAAERRMVEQQHSRKMQQDAEEQEDQASAITTTRNVAEERVTNIKKQVVGHATSKTATTKSKKVSTKKQSNGQTSQTQQTPPIKATTNQHPGMNQFNHWFDVEASLFRIYTLGRNDGEQVVPPYVPHSYRGNVQVFVHITNSTSIPINVYWVDYSGKHMFKGELKSHGGVWTQTTFIDHPWVLENAETQEVLMHYVPYRVIPTIPEAPTVSDDGVTGMHKFELLSPNDDTSPFHLRVRDAILPFPAADHFTNPTSALAWTMQQMARMGIDDIQVDTLLKYLSNIVHEPAVVKYRQIRIRSSRFSSVWMSPARGILLALGFSEEGAHAELGCSQELDSEGVQLVALAIYLIMKWKDDQEVSRGKPIRQPDGADGYGRQGYGRAGTMN